MQGLLDVSFILDDAVVLLKRELDVSIGEFAKLLLQVRVLHDQVGNVFLLLETALRLRC